MRQPRFVDSNNKLCLDHKKNKTTEENGEEEDDSDYDPDAPQDDNDENGEAENNAANPEKQKTKEEIMEKIKETRRLIRMEEGEECSLNGEEEDYDFVAAEQAEKMDPEAESVAAAVASEKLEENKIPATSENGPVPEKAKNNVLDELDEEEYEENSASADLASEMVESEAADAEDEPSEENEQLESEIKASLPPESMDGDQAGGTQHGILDTLIVERKKLFKVSELEAEREAAKKAAAAQMVPIRDVQKTELVFFAVIVVPLKNKNVV